MMDNMSPAETVQRFIDLVRDGLIAEWQVYADNEPIRQRMRTPA